MRTHPKAWTAGIAGATLIVALVLFLAPQFREPSAARPASTHAAARNDAPAVQPMRIVPVEASAAPAHWAPLTGDGSN